MCVLCVAIIVLAECMCVLMRLAGRLIARVRLLVSGIILKTVVRGVQLLWSMAWYIPRVAVTLSSGKAPCECGQLGMQGS